MYSSILIITHNPLAGSALGNYLQDSKVYKLAYASFDRLNEISADRDPDVLLLLGGEENEDRLREAIARYPRAKPILIFRSGSPLEQIEWLNQGIRGLINEREDDLRTLESVIAKVTLGQVWASRQIFSQLSSESPRRRPGEIYSTLTAREREVMNLVSTGLRNAVVAERLGIAEKTVKSHLSRIFQKLEVRNRVQATVRYRESVTD